MPPFSPSSVVRRSCLRIAACLPMLLLSSCVTMGLWGYQWREDGVDADGEELGYYELAEGTRWEWWRVVLRVLTTPVTLACDGAVGCIEGMVSLEWWLPDEDETCPGRTASRSAGRPASRPGAPRPASSGKSILSGVRGSRP